MTTIAAGRLDVVRHMIARLSHSSALSGVDVWHGWPSDKHVTAQMVWAGELTGDCDVPVMTGAFSRHHRSDVWQIDWYVRVAGVLGPSPQQAVCATHDRLAVVCGALEDLVADDPTVDERVTLLDARVTRVEHAVELTPDGPFGYGHVVMSCESRLD